MSGLGMWIGVAAVGALAGFLGGLFGKGGSAVATPLLVAVGLPPIVAVAAPLPATIPGTLAAARWYRRYELIDPQVVIWSIAAGVPATIVGALLTAWVPGGALVTATEVLLVILGLRLVLRPGEGHEVVRDVPHLRARSLGVAIAVGLTAGLLANSGGFLLAPLYLAVLRLPLKRALGTSLMVSAFLAVPGTIVHAALGHIDWAVVVVFGAASVPLSTVGARVALWADSAKLERIFGVALVSLGVGFLALAVA